MREKINRIFGSDLFEVLIFASVLILSYKLAGFEIMMISTLALFWKILTDIRRENKKNRDTMITFLDSLKNTIDDIFD